MGKKFVTWTHGGVKFLAVVRGSNVVVINEYGQGFGAWMSVYSFRDMQRRGATAPLGVVNLSVSAAKR